MKRIALILLFGFCQLICPAQNPTSGSDERSIVVIFENDAHCRIDRYAAFAGYRDAVLESDTAYVATVSIGDFLQGGYAGGVSEGAFPSEIVGSSGYDVMTLGNHEFDYGMRRLRELVRHNRLQIVCSNLTHKSKTVFKPYIIKRFGRIRVAFVGVLTPGTILTEPYAFYRNGRQVYDTNGQDAVRMVQDAVNHARRKGADYVVLLSHLGESESVQTKVTSHSVASQTCGIDVVLDGHSHSRVPGLWLDNSQGGKVLVAQTGTQLENIGKLVISPDGQISTELIPTDSVTYISKRVQSVTERIDRELKVKGEEVVGYVDFDMSATEGNNRIVRTQETNLGDFVADAYRAVTGSDIAFSNGGGIRANLPRGEIRYHNLMDLHPFTNNLCVARMSGQMILDGLEQSYAVLPQEYGGFLQVSGLRFTIDTRIPYGNLSDGSPRRVRDVMVEVDGRWQMLDPLKTYSVASSDYVLYLGSETPAFNSAEIVNFEVCPDSEAIVRYLRDVLKGKVPFRYESPEGRITIIR